MSTAAPTIVSRMGRISANSTSDWPRLDEDALRRSTAPPLVPEDSRTVASSGAVRRHPEVRPSEYGGPERPRTTPEASAVGACPAPAGWGEVHVRSRAAGAELRGPAGRLVVRV